MKIKILIAAMSIAAASQANAQIGWTLDQCRAKYGTEIGGDKIDSFVFQVTGFKVTMIFQVTYPTGGGFARGGVKIIQFEPENPITFAQAKQILTKVSNTIWKRDPDPAVSDDEMDTWKTKMTTGHNIDGQLTFAAPNSFNSTKPDRTHVEAITVMDDTVIDQESKEAKAEQEAQDKADKAKAQSNVDGL